jgi:hypothetical protein
MHPTETALWEKIKLFQFNEPGIDFSFEQRLARENGWPTEYTRRVIEEYKKFIFLCCISETGITPSDPVDQAWHLHLTFTRSYWIDLCKNTLQKEIHHNPTKGGQQEATRFNNYYTTSFELYKQKFNTDPPADIWHHHQKRFSDINFQRVNLREYWLLRKPSMFYRRMLLLVGICLFALLSIQASNALSVFAVALAGIIVVIVVEKLRSKKKKNRHSGCSATGVGCASGCGTKHGDSGCGSGCSGDSGCSGCGGGGD